MAIAGGPLPGRTGILLYSVQTEQGTPVTPATAVGIASFEVTTDAGLVPIYALGGPNALFLKDGTTNGVTGSINITALQDETFIAKALRSAGVVPWITLGFAYQDDAGTDYMWQVADCKLNTLDVSLDAAGLLTAAVNFLGGDITEITSGVSVANLSQTPFASYEAVLEVGGSGAEAISFRLQINNNVEPVHVIPAAAPSSPKRLWAYLVEGNQEITGELTRFARSGVDMQGDSLTDFAVALTLTDVAGGETPNAMKFTVSNAKFGSESWSASPEGRHEFRTPFTARTVAIGNPS